MIGKMEEPRKEGEEKEKKRIKDGGTEEGANMERRSTGWRNRGKIQGRREEEGIKDGRKEGRGNK